MTRSKNLRLYRACQRCRQRKLKCDPTSAQADGDTACFECIRAGQECKLAGSRRGGNFAGMRRAQKPPSPIAVGTSPNRAASSHNSCYESTSGASHLAEESDPGEPIYDELNNPGDALHILARLAAIDAHSTTASNGEASSHSLCSSTDQRNSRFDERPCQSSWVDPALQSLASSPLSETEILVNEVLGLDKAYQLLHDYHKNYHPFCPLVSKALLETTNIRQVASNEPFLLTAILTIASKDDPNLSEIYQHCWQAMKKLMLDVLLASPSTLNVSAIEGLILLSEWVSYEPTENSNNSDHRNISVVEDNVAWSLVGQAVRHAYLLRLDKTSFREKVPGDSQDIEDRKRLAWIFVYIADRQISVRLGQSFWSRGPSLSTRFTANDFPSLQLSEDSEHSYALVLLATIELTQLLHNVHSILYSSKIRTLQMMLSGDYNRYLEDFGKALSSWQDCWRSLKASPKLNSTLRIVFEYVRLYVNAFSFQSVVSRASRGGLVTSVPLSRDRGQSIFPQGIMASADGAYVYEAVNAAKSILSIMIETDPVAHIRYMPFRFYVYTIYSAVFLFKVNLFGAFSAVEQNEVISLVRQFICILGDAATSDRHIGYRYSKLLKRLWFNEKIPSKSLAATRTDYTQNQNQSQPKRGESYDSQQRLPNDSPDNGIPTYAFPSDMSIPFLATELGLTPDFNTFCPNFFALETELFNAGMGSNLDFNGWAGDLGSGVDYNVGLGL